jgi:hypothetical protein
MRALSIMLAGFVAIVALSMGIESGDGKMPECGGRRLPKKDSE